VYVQIKEEKERRLVRVNEKYFFENAIRQLGDGHEGHITHLLGLLSPDLAM